MVTLRASGPSVLYVLLVVQVLGEAAMSAPTPEKYTRAGL